MLGARTNLRVETCPCKPPATHICRILRPRNCPHFHDFSAGLGRTLWISGQGASRSGERGRPGRPGRRRGAGVSRTSAAFSRGRTCLRRRTPRRARRRPRSPGDPSSANHASSRSCESSLIRRARKSEPPTAVPTSRGAVFTAETAAVTSDSGPGKPVFMLLWGGEAACSRFCADSTEHALSCGPTRKRKIVV